MSIYKACDIRGKFGADLQVHHAAGLGAAIRDLKGPGTVLVAGDGRLSTPQLKEALILSLLQGGCQVVDLGFVPTPVFYFARAHLGIEVGVIVTASHNPAGDNGFKITLGPLPITTGEMQELAARMERHAPVMSEPTGKVEQVNLLPAYLSSLVPHTPDLRGLRVVVDCANGMAGVTARAAWQRTGAEITYLLEETDGHFPGHAPNPAEVKNLALLRQTVLDKHAHLGAAYDGDADRVAFVDELGQPLTNDRVIVLFARAALQSGPETIIYDQKCSRVVPDSIHALGGTPVMELSGHTYIKRAFLEHNAAYAGELSGHHFFRKWGNDDGLAASLQMAQILAASNEPLSSLAAAIPAYPITPDLRIPMEPGLVRQLLSDLETRLAGKAGITRTDGLRFEFCDGWGLVRPSVTEPMVTMRFEGTSPEALERIIGEVENAAPLVRGRLRH